MKRILLAALALCLAALLTGCSGGGTAGSTAAPEAADTGRYLRLVDESPDTVDPQCTSEYYTVALNVFDRLVEIAVDADGATTLAPSLAQSWEISQDGLTYDFHLQEGVRFSNGEALTASDVGYTLTRLLTHPDSQNQDIATCILGAEALRSGQSDTLAGFAQHSDTAFSITLEYPYAAFLACLSTPGASILDEQTTAAAGAAFGVDPAVTVGTGPFVLTSLKKGSGMLLAANRDCWSGAPACDGLDVRFTADPESQRLMFERGELDILDLDALGDEAEFFIHGDIYQQQLRQGPRVGISYIALNQSIKPLDDVRVRRALQLALDRETLLNAIYSGRGAVENGIFPHGLIGFDPDLPAIPYDPAQARALLAEAGYPMGFPLEISLPLGASQRTRELLTLVDAMWHKVGVRVTLKELREEDFMARRRAGSLACYTNTWSADFNDPDNFIYTFFGTAENTRGRSLCYPDAEIIRRVRDARAIVDDAARLHEYQALEQRIVQQDAAWVPLFSRQHIFVVNRRVQGFRVAWNGWSSNSYRNVSVLSD